MRDQQIQTVVDRLYAAVGRKPDEGHYKAWRLALKDLDVSDGDLAEVVSEYLKVTEANKVIHTSNFRNALLPTIRRRTAERAKGRVCDECQGEGWVLVDPRYAQQFPEEMQTGAENSMHPCGMCEEGNRLRTMSQNYESGTERLDRILRKEKQHTVDSLASDRSAADGFADLRRTLATIGKAPQ